MEYAIVFDNVNQQTTARQHSSSHQNKQFNLTHCYAAKNRISFPCHTDTPTPPEAIMNVPHSAYVPSADDMLILSKEVKVNTYNIPPQENYSILYFANYRI